MVFKLLFLIYGLLFSIIRLCKETPSVGGRLFEMGDEELLRFAHKHQGAFSSSLHSLQLTSGCQLVPIVIVFIQYSKLAMAKRAELEEDLPLLDKDTIPSEEEAWKAFENCRRSLEHMMRRLALPIPPLARISGIFVPFHYLVLTAC